MKRLVFLMFCPLLAGAQNLQFGPQAEYAQSQAQPLDEIALVINQEAISRRQLEKELTAARAALPRDIPLSGTQLQELLMDRVIIQHVIEQLAQQYQVQVSDEEIDEGIMRVAEQNQLSPADLQSQVQKQTGMNAQQYRQSVAEQIRQAKLQEALVGNQVSITSAQINDQLTQIARREGSTIHLQDLLLPVPNLPVEERGAAIAETLARISDALRAHNNDLSQAAAEIPEARLVDLGQVNIGQIPLRFASAVAGLRGGQMVNKPVVDADGMHFLKVVSTSVAGGEGYIVPQARMAHILIRHNPHNPQAAKATIEQIYAALQQGADFATLAQQYSQDPASALRGGELGWLSADTLDPRFAEQMIKAPPGSLQAPFESSFGWHILKVYEREQVDRSEDMLRERIRASLYQSAMQQAWERRIIEARQNAYIRIY